MPGGEKMAKETAIARARLRAHVFEVENYFDRIFELLEVDAVTSALDVFGRGYTARIRASEGSLLLEAVVSTGAILGVVGGAALGAQKFLVDYIKMKEGLAAFIKDAKKFGQAFQARFAVDTKELPLQEESYEAEALAPQQLLEFLEIIDSIDEATTVQERRRRIEVSYKIAKRLRSILSERDKEHLLTILSGKQATSVGKYEELLLEHTGGKGPARSSGRSETKGGRGLIPHRPLLRRSKTIKL